MNVLPANDIVSSVDHLSAYNIRLKWKQACHHQSLQADHMVVRNFVLGLPLKRGFSPVINSTKLCNGQTPWGAWQHAYNKALKSDTSWAWLGQDGDRHREEWKGRLRQEKDKQ